ncbi:hypothetical protein GGU45_000932 [Niabella hirudinis]
MYICQCLDRFKFQNYLTSYYHIRNKTNSHIYPLMYQSHTLLPFKRNSRFLPLVTKDLLVNAFK